MNQRDKYIQEREILSRYTKYQSVSRPEINVIYIRGQNTDVHEHAKVDLALKHIRMGCK